MTATVINSHGHWFFALIGFLHFSHAKCTGRQLVGMTVFIVPKKLVLCDSDSVPATHTLCTVTHSDKDVG